MDCKPIISVIIPAYNYADKLPRSVNSVLGQLTETVELIVIDDGSTDATGKVLGELLQESKSAFRVIYKENGGLSSVRNLGIKEAQSDYFIFLDADDELIDGALQLVVTHIAQNPQSKMIIGGHKSVWEENGKIKVTIPHSIPESAAERLRGYLLDKRISLCNGATVMHRTVFEKGLYPEDLYNAEDVPVFAQALAGFFCTVISVPIVKIYKHKQSMRHDIKLSSKVGMSLVEEVFDKGRIDTDFYFLRSEYESSRALSLARDYYRAGMYKYSRGMYWYAFKNHPKIIFKLSYLRKFIKAIFKRDGF